MNPVVIDTDWEDANRVLAEVATWDPAHLEVRNFYNAFLVTMEWFGNATGTSRHKFLRQKVTE